MVQRSRLDGHGAGLVYVALALLGFLPLASLCSLRLFKKNSFAPTDLNVASDHPNASTSHLQGDDGGYIKYWQSNMNNVTMFLAHKDKVREVW